MSIVGGMSCQAGGRFLLLTITKGARRSVGREQSKGAGAPKEIVVGVKGLLAGVSTPGLSQNPDSCTGVMVMAGKGLRGAKAGCGKGIEGAPRVVR